MNPALNSMLCILMLIFGGAALTDHAGTPGREN